jgi:RNA polymerase sigma-70 factor (family 1)
MRLNHTKIKSSPESLQHKLQLLRLTAQGNEEAFTALFHLYKYKLHGYILSLTDSPALTDDIVQEVFMKLWRTGIDLSAVEQPDAYIFRMAKNHAIDAFRRLARETRLLSGLKQHSTSLDSPGSQPVEIKELERVIKRVVDALPPQQKLVYTLSREQGMKHEDIAEQLNISAGTVKNHMIQALRSIRNELRKHPEFYSSALLSLIAFYSQTLYIF